MNVIKVYKYNLYTKNLNHESLYIVKSEIGHVIYLDYNISIKMICLNHGSGGF
jgi:hypothetical protein